MKKKKEERIEIKETKFSCADKMAATLTADEIVDAVHNAVYVAFLRGINYERNRTPEVEAKLEACAKEYSETYGQDVN